MPFSVSWHTLLEQAEDRNTLLVLVFVGDAGSKRLHIVDRRDAGINQSCVWCLESLCW